jgi:hypothetical protein
MVVALSKPILGGAYRLKGTGLLLPSGVPLFQGGYEALRVCIALQIVVPSERLMELQYSAGLHEGRRGRPTPIVSHNVLRSSASCFNGKQYNLRIYE